MIAVKGKFKGPYATVAPELCVEIMSTGDTLRRSLDKAALYIRWGAGCVWIIDPDKRMAWTLSPEGAEPKWIAPVGVLRIGGTAIELPVLFAEVDLELDGAARE